MDTKTLTVAFIAVVVLAIGIAGYVFLYVEEQATSAKIPAETTTTGEVSVTSRFTLPLSGSAPTTDISHTIPLTDIRRGCGRQNCIPSIENPQFIPASDLVDVLPADSLGIYIAQAERFYPFPMLETHEIVNDLLPSGLAVAVTYCPLCGTGIVFDRTIDGEVVEFGVSGMLWQSNLLMYNRAADLGDRNLWSQVLGQAVVGDRSGQSLAIVQSDILRFSDWLTLQPTGQTLTTGNPRDPYDGNYYAVARNFQPDFDLATSELAPMTRVHGIIVNGQPKAYVSEALFADQSDFVGGERVFVERDATGVRFLLSNADLGAAPTIVPDIEGFWFSWVAAHPDTELWTGK